MLQLDQSLPPGCLIGGEAAVLAGAMAASTGVWFTARDDKVQRDGDRITGWQDTTGAVIAGLSEPNKGNSRFIVGRHPAFGFETGTHCGFFLPEVMPKVDCFSLAVIYSSPAAEARTLASLSTGQTNNIIFLSETGGALTASDRNHGISLELPLPPITSATRMVMLSFTGVKLSLTSGGRTVSGSGKILGLDHPADFFIGCRSNRAGLTKTLGQSLIHEVLFWPDRALIGSADPVDVAALDALNHYYRWSY